MAKAKTPAEEAADLRAAIREAHEAMQGLRDLIREWRALKAELEAASAQVFTDRMEAAVQEGLDSYAESIGKAIDDATAAVDRRFDTIASIMLGEDPATVRKGLPSIKDYAEQIAAERRERTNAT